MSGFEIPRDTVTIAFSEGGYAGAEITCRLNVPLREFNATRLTVDQLSEERALEQWVERWVVSWNLEEDGAAIPVTKEGAQRVPSDLLYSVLGVWREQLNEYVQAPAPLGPFSRNGRPSARELVSVMDES